MKSIKPTETKVNVPVDEGILSCVESKMYERNSRRDLIAYALGMNMSLDTDSFRKYQQELIDYTREYDMAVDTMINTVVKPYLSSRYQVDTFNYQVNFEEGWVECTFTAAAEQSDASVSDE